MRSKSNSSLSTSNTSTPSFTQWTSQVQPNLSISQNINTTQFANRHCGFGRYLIGRTASLLRIPRLRIPNYRLLHRASLSLDSTCGATPCSKSDNEILTLSLQALNGSVGGAEPRNLQQPI